MKSSKRVPHNRPKGFYQRSCLIIQVDTLQLEPCCCGSACRKNPHAKRPLGSCTNRCLAGWPPEDPYVLLIVECKLFKECDALAAAVSNHIVGVKRTPKEQPIFAGSMTQSNLVFQVCAVYLVYSNTPTLELATCVSCSQHNE
jgi:hypothetical protein